MPATTNYLDFDLAIERDGETYRARVIDSPGGQASSQFQLPFSPLELENFLLRVGMSLSEIRRNVRRIDSSDMAEVKGFGGRLFRAVFDEELRPTLLRSLDEARRRDAGLRLRVRLSGAPELADWPWEYLYDTNANRFLNLSVETPVVRYLELSEPARALSVQPPLKVLVMISGPSDVRRLDVDAEWDRIKSAVADLEDRNLISVERLEAANLAALQRSLRRGEYHIFHYVGHGGYDHQTQDGVLLLEGMDGRSRPVSGQDLGTLLHDHRSLRLVVLNSCEGARTSPTDPFAGTAQSLVQQGIPAVIAMQFEITDEAAILLSHEFYAALSDGYPVDTALGEARKAIFASGNEVEWATPVLYMRSANGRIFRLARPDASERPKTAAVEEPVVPPPTPEAKPPADVPQPSPVRTIEAPVAAPTLPPTAPTPAAVEEPTVPAPAAVAEPTAPTPTKPSLPRLPANLILIGAALALLSSGQYLSDSPELVWFMPEKLLAIAGSAAVAFLVLNGRQPPGGIGAALGLGLYLLAVTLPFVYNDDSGLFVANLGLAIGSGLIVGGAIALLRRSPQFEAGSVGWLPALGGLLIGVALFLPVTSSDGPEYFAVMGEWLVGNRQAVLLPLLLLAAWVFFLSLYPSRRVGEQRGQLLGVGAELLVAFPTMVGYFTFYEGWGTAFGLWIAIIGAALVVVGSWRAIRQANVSSTLS
jgi:hypothetical protein